MEYLRLLAMKASMRILEQKLWGKPMTLDEIRTKKKELELREKELLKQRKVLKAEQVFIQSVCEHPNKRSWTSSDYGGGSDLHEVCDDCGYSRTT